MSKTAAQWVEVCKTVELPVGERKIIDLDEKHIMVLNNDGDYYAIESMCTHAMFELDDAEIEKCAIVCPLHGAHFCLKTGEPLTPPAFEAIDTYEVRVQNDIIEISVEE